MQQDRCCPRSQGRRGERDGLERQARGRAQSLLRFLFRRAGENGRLKTSRDHGNLPRTPGFPYLGQNDPRRCLGRPLRRNGNVSALERCVAADRQEIRGEEDWQLQYAAAFYASIWGGAFWSPR